MQKMQNRCPESVCLFWGEADKCEELKEQQQEGGQAFLPESRSRAYEVGTEIYGIRLEGNILFASEDVNVIE